MKTIYCDNFLQDLKEEDFSQGSSLTMGNFDGCHLAHQEILLRVKEKAHQTGTLSVALTFFPHPREFFSQKREESTEKRIFSLKQKLEALESFGLDYVIVQRFHNDFSKLSHEDFYSLGIKKKLNTKNIVIGSNFCFGHKRLGTAAWLVERGLNDSTHVEPMPLKKQGDSPVNSTRVRTLLASGEVEKAKDLLARPFYLDGLIVRGNQMGRKLGFPTANFSSIEQILPAPGVYSGFLEILEPKEESKRWQALINVGFRPTVHEGAKELTVEAHCLEAKEDLFLYGKICRLFFHHRLRSEKKFPHLEALKEQIHADKKKAKSLLTAP